MWRMSLFSGYHPVLPSSRASAVQPGPSEHSSFSSYLYGWMSLPRLSHILSIGSMITLSSGERSTTVLSPVMLSQ